MRNTIRLAIALTILLIGVVIVPYAKLPSEQFNWQLFSRSYHEEANLAVAKLIFNSPITTTVTAGDIITYTLSVYNTGPDAATNVTLTDALPPEVSLAYVNPPGLCAGTTSLVCNLGTISPSNTINVTVVVTAVTAGSALNSTMVFANETDVDPLNNVDEVWATIIPGPPDTITLNANPTMIIADGVSTSTLTAMVTDLYGNVVTDGTQVSFSTDLGTILGSPQNTTFGMAMATLQSSVVTGTATITAQSGSAIAATTVDFVDANAPATLILNANPPAIPGDGISTSIVTATVYNLFGNPIDGATINLETDLGSLSPTSGTSVGGIVTSTLTSEVAVGTATITASTSNLNANTSVVFQPYPTAINLLAVPTSIPGDGTSTATLTAYVIDQIGNPVPDGTAVVFATDLGSLDVITTTTVSGEATAILTSDVAVGIANVSATAENVVDTATVTFEAYLDSLTFTASPTSIPGDGSSTSTVTATAYDQVGGLLDGVVVTFDTDMGSLSPISATTVSGVATSTLTSALAIDTATLTATAESLTANTTVDFEAYLDSLDFAANPTSILGDGASTSTVTATAYDQLGGLLDGVVVSFATDMGSLSPVSATTVSGVATTTLTSALAVDTATLTATADSLVANTTVTFEAYLDSLDFTANPTSILGDGSSTSTLTATAYDQVGNPWDGVVTFATDMGSVSPVSATTVSGVATSTLTSAVAVDTATLIATIDSLTANATVTFEAYPAALVLSANPSSLPADGVSISTLTATVTDQVGNPVPDGTEIVFTTDLGSLGSITGTTSTGVATTTLLSNTEGTATITATVANTTVNNTTSVIFTPTDTTSNLYFPIIYKSRN